MALDSASPEFESQLCLFLVIRSEACLLTSVLPSINRGHGHPSPAVDVGASEVTLDVRGPAECPALRGHKANLKRV